jgi:hypothetical protein
MSNQETQEAVENTAPELTVQDLGNLRAIIDVAAQRGAFRAPEMEAVGSAFNKLNNFLNAVTPAQEETAETEEAAESPAAE